MSVRVEVRPRVLEWARARSGIDDEVWEQRFPRYDAWLTGASAPTLKQLEDFARKTHTPVGFFFLEEPPVETVPIPDFRTISDRPVAAAGAAVSADLLDVIYACERRQEWYRDNQLLEGEPPLPFVGAASTADAVDEVAGQMRQVLDWTAQSRAVCRTSDAALTWLRERAEAAGVLVMISGIVGSNTHRALDPQEFRGFALVDRYAAVVFVNGADSKAAQVFTLVHELAHLWLGETALSDLDPQSIRSNAVERWCNQVAAEFLWADERSGSNSPPATITVRRASGGYSDAVQSRVGRRFASAVARSTLEGRTPYPRAFRLLGLKKAATFDRLVESVGVR